MLPRRPALSDRAGALAISADGSQLFVALPDVQAIEVVELATLTTSGTIGLSATGSGPSDIVAGATHLYATCDDGFSIIDARSLTETWFGDGLFIGTVRNALLGVNAVVVGLLLAALYNPVWTSAILSPTDFGLALAAFTLLVFWKTPAWLVVILTALGGWALHAGAAMS